eukprot:Pgem_evm1s19841
MSLTNKDMEVEKLSSEELKVRLEELKISENQCKAKVDFYSTVALTSIVCPPIALVAIPGVLIKNRQKKQLKKQKIECEAAIEARWKSSPELIDDLPVYNTQTALTPAEHNRQLRIIQEYNRRHREDELRRNRKLKKGGFEEEKSKGESDESEKESEKGHGNRIYHREYG